MSFLYEKTIKVEEVNKLYLDIRTEKHVYIRTEISYIMISS